MSEPDLSLAGAPIRHKFLLSSSAENLIRLECLLERQRELGVQVEFDSIIAAMLDRCRSYKEYYLQQAATIGKVFRDEPISAIEDIGLRTLLRNCINTFLVLHELLLFLPRERIRRELLFFSEQLFGPNYYRQDLSIILTSVYNAFEYSLDAAIRSLDVYMMKLPDPKKLDFGHVMELAIIDRDNPMSWALLAHEFGHYLDAKHNISGPLTDLFIDKELKVLSSQREQMVKIFSPLASELLADFTAYYLIGAVGIMPVVNMDLNFGMATDQPLPYDGVHPHTTTRLRVVSEAAAADQMPTSGLFSSYIQALSEDEAIKVALLGPTEQKERASIKRLTEFFAQWLRNDVMSRLAGLGLKRFTASNLATAELLKASLKDGVPVGCSREHSDDTIRFSLDGLGSPPDVAKTREALAMFSERPVNVSEVIAAGWMVSSERKIGWLQEAFQSKDPSSIFPTLRKAI